MAKFNEYTQKATPADNDTMMIYDAAAKANKLSPFSGIWNWIVGKLTNAVISNLQTSNQTVIGAINELGGNSHLGTLNDNIAEYLRKTKKVATAYFVWGNIGGLYPSWAWGTLLCSNDNTANFIGIANSNKTAAFAHYENGAWEKVPVESLSNLTTTNKSSLVGAINELNSNRQAGLSELVTIPVNSMLKIDITFKKPFSKIPTVLCCIRSGSEMYKYGSVSAFVDFNSITTTGFTAKIANNSDVNVSPNVSWIAVI
jgi:hypothetical protein